MTENVKELMEEVKNLSELMLDLAYSSLFFESKDIAKEVMILYNELEELEERLYLHLFAATRGRAAAKYVSVIDFVESSKMVATAAKNLAETILEGKEMHPVIKAALQESDESIVRATVTKKSVLKGRTLGETRLRTEMGTQIIAIRRGSKWIFDPNKGSQMLEGDVLFGVGPQSSCEKLSKLSRGDVRKI